LLFAWQNIVGYYLLTILASFFIGALTVNIERSLKLDAIAFIAGCIVFISLYILPPMLYGQSYERQVDVMIALVTTQLARTIIVSFPVSVFACLFGCLSGITSAER